MIFVIDIDDTLLMSPQNKKYDDIWKRYEDAIPDLVEIKRVNELYEKNHTIILHTGRNWDKYELTKEQLKQFNIKYDELVMGKPQGIYIDKDSCKTLEEFTK